MTAQRMVLFTFAAVVSAGIWHTGFDKASWILYVPMALSVFAGITGICPSLIFWQKCGLNESDATFPLTPALSHEGRGSFSFLDGRD